MFAVKKHCGQDNEKFSAFLTRIFAVQKMLREKELSPWLRMDPDGGPPAAHAAVWEVAATMPVTQAGDFDVPEFCRRVAKLETR